MLIAIILLFINTLSKVNGQQLPARTLSPGLSHAHFCQEPFRPQTFMQGQSFSRLSNSLNKPYVPACQDSIGPYSATFYPQSPVTSRSDSLSAFEQFASNSKRLSDFKSQVPFTPSVQSNSRATSLPLENAATVSNQPGLRECTPLPTGNNPLLLSIIGSLSERYISPGLDTSLNKETSRVPLEAYSTTKQNLPAAPRSQVFDPIPSLGFGDPQFIPNFPQIPQIPFSSLIQPTPNPPLPSYTAHSPSAAEMAIQFSKSIPSPLSLTDSIPYLQDDPIFDTFDAPIIASPIGCLDLTVTPYGTISETPLPDPSIKIPRGPFLPVASPVSALAPPLSPLLPSATPAARGSTFLRKVPVPPPFI